MKLGMQIVSPKPLFQLARIVVLPSAGMCDSFFAMSGALDSSDTNWHELARINAHRIEKF